jgi:hypothetical protein
MQLRDQLDDTNRSVAMTEPDLRQMTRRESCPQQPCTCSYLGEQPCPYYLRVREIQRDLEQE